MAQTKKSFIIRNLKWEDMNDLVSNYYSYFDEAHKDPHFGILTYGKKPPFVDEVAWFANLYSNTLKRHAVVSVAEVDGIVVGMCDIQRKSDIAETRHIGILGIAVKKEYRSMGIGRALLEDAIRRSRGMFDEIILSVLEGNEVAYKLYKSIGFKDIGANPAGIKRKGRYIGERDMYLILKKRKKL